MAITTPKRVDKEINLSDLHAQQNSSLPIFWLPPETLEEIFIYAARDYYEDDNRFNICVPHWVNVTYVCSRWRNVALNCPTLWTYHFTASPQWTKELLARSKHASLKIRIHYKNDRARPWWSRLTKESLSHAGRIEELRLTIPGDIFPVELSLNAPLLQTLDLNFGPYAPKRTLMINNGDSLLLRTLKLAHCPLPWHSAFNLSGVTILSLGCLCSSFQQDVPEFLATLSGMQALTILDVERSLPSARGFLSSEAFGVLPKVTLPCLTRFFVHAPLSTITALLSRMNLPSKTRVRLDVEPEFNSSVDDYAQLSSLLTQRFSQLEHLSSSIPAIRSLSVCFSYNSDFTLSASECHDYDCDLYGYPPEDHSAPLLIRVIMNKSIAVGNRVHIVGNICCAIPPTHVQTFLVMNPPSSREFWSKTLGHLAGLRYMKLSGGYMPDLLLADGPGPGDPPGHTFVPGLEKLELYYITFNSSDDDSWLDEIVSEQSLREALSSRREALQLTMTECNTVNKDWPQF